MRAPPFEPIAIVGRACLLPDAPTPEALWRNVLAGRSAIAPAPADRWGVPVADVLGVDPRGAAVDRTWSDAGGYVRAFDFDAQGLALPPEELLALDPLFQWVIRCGREALRPLGHDRPSARAGLVLGNLSFPSSAMARYAESVWLAGQDPSLEPLRRRHGERPHARNRFSSALPAHLAARALGLCAGAFALDAACASSLYAIKLACDRLQDRSADVMLAAAVNRADDLFIHIGFCALDALSRSGRSRPFHRDADGLVPAEGAAVVALQRLDDARAAGRPVLGVIRAVGLSNDGRGRGLLAPSEEGQERAMRLAYAAAGVDPRAVSLLECHATGTPVGDATEVRSAARVFAGARDLPIGSLKSNLGHLVTVAGLAGLLKVLSALEHGTRPPTLHAEAPIAALAGSPFRLLGAPEAWAGPRRAALSAFGFGGNNAHLIVESLDELGGAGRAPRRAGERGPARGEADEDPVAIVAIGARVGEGEGAAALARGLFDEGRRGEPPPRQAAAFALDGLRFPPVDLEHALAQQVLVLEAAREAARGVALPRERTVALIGMGCDAEIARFGARWRVGAWARGAAPELCDEAWVAQARAAFQAPLQAADVLGTMPNVVANRLSSQLDLGGPGFSVSAEEASGLVALALGARALRAGEADAALVGAVDLSQEPVHRAALRALGREAPPGDGAVVLVLRRLSDARRAGEPVLALLEEGGEGAAAPALRLGDVEGAADVVGARFGRAHAAFGLAQVAAAALALHHRARPHEGRPATPCLDGDRAEVAVSVLEGGTARAALRAADRAGWLAADVGRLRVYAGSDRAGCLAALAEGREAGAGPARLVLVATDEELPARAREARGWLERGGPAPEGAAFCAAPLAGETAFVFTGAAAAYAGMGRELALALPQLVDRVAERCGELLSATGWIYGADPERAPQPLDQLWGASFVCQLHRELGAVLGLRAQATIGYSSGESNALFAMGAWRDMGRMIAESKASPIFSSELVGDFAAPRRAWRRLGRAGERWSTFAVAASSAAVERAIRQAGAEALVHVTITNTADHCVLGGEAEACARVVAALGPERALPLGYEMAVHCPEVEEIGEAWRALHHRETRPVEGVRFYTSAAARCYRADADAAADAITEQALRTLDFPRVIEQAYADGVRVFIEHGPRGLCSGWIRRILGERPHLAVPFDQPGRCGVRQALNAAAWLTAAGAPVDVEALYALLPRSAPARPQGARRERSAHPPAPRLPPLQPATQFMALAPRLPPVLNDPTYAAGRAAPPAPALAEPRGAVAPLAIEPRPLVAPPPAAPSLAAAAAAPHRSPQQEVLAGLLSQHAHVAAVHQQFLTTQAVLDARFLAVRQATQRALVQAYHAAPHLAAQAALPLPTPAVAPPRAEHAAPPLTAPATTPPEPRRPGPQLSRADLEILASGSISSVFGPLFAPQDRHARQVRMPEPPLLLADRVTGIAAEPAVLRTGTIWTETDVRGDSWYLNDEGRMPAGLLIEAGQADLLLISWMGIDLLNNGERVYRLLGCELTFHGGLPEPGDTLRYDIHIDGHAQQGDVRLFFFHYDCRVGGAARLSVRGGQAGFFSDAELAQSGGVLWDCAAEPCDSTRPLDPPAIPCRRSSFSADEVRAFAAGRPADCFGDGWEATRAHVRTPRITSGSMLFLDRVAAFDPAGGPWGRGYLRAESPVTPDDWYFAGHFKNDPCMPGTLMFEGCLQAMAFYLAALGLTADHDGWRFEPVPEERYVMRCRGQVTPQSRSLVYEVFVSEVVAGPEPTLFADLLCTVDGRKAFHARRVGLRLVPDWPLSHWRRLGPPASQETGERIPLPRLGGLLSYAPSGAAAQVDGFAFDYPSMLACAWGRPSEAFGPFYSAFDGARRVARLPGPPYHFLTRVTRVEGPMGAMRAPITIEAEYEIPEAQWYFEQNGAAVMPFCVLMEAALQPCGWLASYVGSALTTEIDLLFRNLDGTGKLLEEIGPSVPGERRALRTRVTLRSISRSAGMLIESFAVECLLGDRRVYEMDTVFGFFPKEAFADQAGLPTTEEERARSVAPTAPAARRWEPTGERDAQAPRLAGPMLRMIDRVTALEANGGRAGLGYARAEKTVDPDEWFFKAHFFQDPVQPGSLGIEALCQLLQLFMRERGMAEGLTNPRFEPLMLGRPVTWKYRGQVVPTNRLITTEIEVTEAGRDDRGAFAVADASLWVDGKKIYAARGLGMRIVAGEAGGAEPPEEILDPETDRWLADHRPTWTLPALPMMSMVDRLAAAAQAQGGRRVTGLSGVQVRRWLPLPGGPQRLRVRTEARGGSAVYAVLEAWRRAGSDALSRFEPVASGTVHFEDQGSPPPPLPPLQDPAPLADPYESGRLFHGPAFQHLTELRVGAGGSSAVLRAEGAVPRGALHQGLLDAMTHGVLHDELSAWLPQVDAGQVAYPYRISELRLFSPLPEAGSLRLETRAAGFDGDPRLPAFDIQLLDGDRVLAALRLVEILVPKGPIGAAPRPARRAFLRDRAPDAAISLSAFDGATTTLSEGALRESDWLPGNVASIYRVEPGARGDLLAAVALREHVGRRAAAHPGAVGVEPLVAEAADSAAPRPPGGEVLGAGGELFGARAAARPLRLYPVMLERRPGAVAVRDAGEPRQDLRHVRAYWRGRIGVGPWPVEDLFYGLIARFVGEVVLQDPDAFAAARGRGCLYLGNHQVGIESLLFGVLASALSGVPTLTLAKAEHRTSWLGTLIAHAFSFPGVNDPDVIAFFDREDRASLLPMMERLGGELRRKSVLVHAEGTRALTARHAVRQLSSSFLDLALAVGAPIVPVRFAGGLPVEPLRERSEFPVGLGRQQHWLGRPIWPEELARLPYKDRKTFVLDAINGLGPGPAAEVPGAPDAALQAAVDQWRAEAGASHEQAVLFAALAGAEAPCADTLRLLESARARDVALAADARGQWLGRLAQRFLGVPARWIRGR